MRDTCGLRLAIRTEIIDRDTVNTLLKVIVTGRSETRDLIGCAAEISPWFRELGAVLLAKGRPIRVTDHCFGCTLG